MLTGKPFTPDVLLARSAETGTPSRAYAVSAQEASVGSFDAAMKQALTENAADLPPDSQAIATENKSETRKAEPRKEDAAGSEPNRPGRFGSAFKAESEGGASAGSMATHTSTEVIEKDAGVRGGETRSGNGARDNSSETEKKIATWPTVAATKASKPLLGPLEEREEKALEPKHESEGVLKLPTDILGTAPIVFFMPTPLPSSNRVTAPAPITQPATVTHSASGPEITTSSMGAEPLPALPTVALDSPETLSPSLAPRSKTVSAQGSSSPSKDRPMNDPVLAVPSAPAVAPVQEKGRAFDLAEATQTASVASATTVPSVDPSGIATAKSFPWMRKVEETRQASRKPDTTLPRAATLSTDSADSARPGRPDGVVAPPPHREPSLAAEAIRPDLSVTAPPPRAERSAPASEPLRSEPVTAVNSLEHEILTCVAELKRLRPDSMSMLLRPDVRTEVHLHLQLQDGVVEIEAKLQRGEWSAWSASWGQLQQNLSGQGVRLSALLEASTPDSGGRSWTGAFQQQPPPRRQPPEEPLRPESSTRPPLSPVSVTAAKEKRNFPTPRSREWWA